MDVASTNSIAVDLPQVTALGKGRKKKKVGVDVKLDCSLGDSRQVADHPSLVSTSTPFSIFRVSCLSFLS
jgi:hypothetical protein